MLVKEFSLTIPTCVLAGKEWGEKSQQYPTILAAHGWLDNAGSFNHLIPLLNYPHIIAIDLPGHGYSSHRPAGIYFHLLDYVAEIISIANTLKLEKFSLLGHSLGASILSLVAGTIPERIDKLVLLDALGAFTASEEFAPSIMQTATIQYENLKNKNIPQYSSREAAIQARLKGGGQIHRASVLTLLERGLKQEGSSYRWRNDPRLLLKPLSMLSELQVAAFLHNISAPTCLIRPERGWPFSEEIFLQRTRLVKNIQVFRVTGDHHAHLDHPAETAKILNSFFQ
jgi:pimeloyl-ACP methyl ester carboxylesterase